MRIDEKGANPIRRNGLAERIAADPPDPFPDSGTVDITVGNLLHLGPWIARLHRAHDGLGAAGRLVHEIGPAPIRLAERESAIDVMDWKQDPIQWGAIHFHDDDVYDAGWETDFSLTIPADMKSGLYAVRLRSGAHEEFVAPEWTLLAPIAQTTRTRALVEPLEGTSG